MSIALGAPRPVLRSDLGRTVRPSRLPLGRPALVSWSLVAMGAVLVPWLGLLAASGQWSWVGLDSLEAAGLITTGLLLRRADPRHSLAAAGTAMLLLTDAWFDTTTAAPGTALAVALGMAICLELPIACLCARLALRAQPQS